MEGLMTRAIIVAAVIAGVGTYFSNMPEKAYEKVTEDQMLQWAPEKVDGMSYVRDLQDPRYTYKMDDVTYNTLKPFGIVARTYTDGMHDFDTVMIMSRERKSFHDPRVCFGAQNWNLENLVPATVKTKTRGEVPITLLSMVNSKTQQKKSAAFFYKGPHGNFYGSTQKLKIAMLVERFKGGSSFEGVFYRVIPGNVNTTKDELLAYIGNFLDAANESSKGRM